MFTIALIGPDGSGKSTVTQRLINECPLPSKSIYMGTNPDACNYMLPTTWTLVKVKQLLGKKNDQGGPFDPDTAKPRSTNAIKNVLRDTKSALLTANLIGEEWFRQAVAWSFKRRKYVVIFDRHFYSDYYSYDIAEGGKGQKWFRRAHGWMLEHLYPKPDLVIFLDAPAEVLFERKQEGTVALLEERRASYLEMQSHFKRFEVVDASQPEEQVFTEVVNTLVAFYQTKTGKKTELPRVTKL